MLWFHVGQKPTKKKKKPQKGKKLHDEGQK
jgi:hypothetical protein